MRSTMELGRIQHLQQVRYSELWFWKLGNFKNKFHLTMASEKRHTTPTVMSRNFERDTFFFLKKGASI